MSPRVSTPCLPWRIRLRRSFVRYSITLLGTLSIIATGWGQEPPQAQQEDPAQSNRARSRALQRPIGRRPVGNRSMTFDRMLRWDADKNGQISRDEFQGPSQTFRMLDINADGQIKRIEFDQRMRERRTRNRPPAADASETRSRSSRRQAMENRVQTRGVAVGDLVDDLNVLTLDGRPTQLASLWQEKPVLLVTASITCPIAVNTCPSMKLLDEAFDERVATAILYVKEAHPNKNTNEIPKSAGVTDPASGFGSYPQPSTQAERQILAKLFHQAFGAPVPVYVSTIDNRFSVLGTGPNSALLIDKGGRLIVKQGWYDADGMKKEIAKLVSAPNTSEPTGNDDLLRTDFKTNLVIGFSQTLQWFGGFEEIAGDDAWEILAHGGAGVDRWSDENYVGWRTAIRSSCPERSGQPDRVLLTISGPFGDDVDRWTKNIQQTIRLIRTKYPSTRQIVLQPVVGGPKGETCDATGRTESVRASRQHPYIVEAIKRVVSAHSDGTVIQGPSPQVRTCQDYSDALGHLTRDASAPIGRALGKQFVAASNDTDAVED